MQINPLGRPLFTITNLDTGQEEARNLHDLLLQLLNTAYDLALACRYEIDSTPELVVTLPKNIYGRLETLAKECQFKATNWGENTNSGLPYFEYDKRDEKTLGTPVRLVVQQGIESGMTEVKN
jgi:hypothetical protein